MNSQNSTISGHPSHTTHCQSSKVLQASMPSRSSYYTYFTKDPNIKNIAHEKMQLPREDDQTLDGAFCVCDLLVPTASWCSSSRESLSTFEGHFAQENAPRSATASTSRTTSQQRWSPQMKQNIVMASRESRGVMLPLIEGEPA